LQSFLSELRVTLYDLFGYLAPGLVALTGLGLFFWAVLDPGLKPDGDLKAVVWTVLLLIAYLLGHVVQAIAGYIPRLKFAIAENWWGDSVAKAFKDIILKKLTAKGLLPDDADGPDLSEDAKRESQAQTYRICDVVTVQKAGTSERELFTYREGFYRGMSVALLIVAVGLFARLIRGPATITLDKDHTADRWMLFFFLVAVLVAAYLYFRRFLQFTRLKAWTVLLGAATSLTDFETEDDPGDTKKAARQPTFEVYKVGRGKYRWRLKAANGQITAISDESFASESNAREAVETVKRTVPLSDIG
jgi:uncharacterized protein YegP (UPF0339 family)